MTSKRLSHSMILPPIMWSGHGWRTNNNKKKRMPLDPHHVPHSFCYHDFVLCAYFCDRPLGFTDSSQIIPRTLHFHRKSVISNSLLQNHYPHHPHYRRKKHFFHITNFKQAYSTVLGSLPANVTDCLLYLHSHTPTSPP